MRPRTRALAAAATLALSLATAFPAIAAERARDSQSPNPFERILGPDRLEQLAAKHKRQAERGPVHPVEGKADYGEAGARFGADRGGRAHGGQDVFAPAGTPLVAVRDTIVNEVGSEGGAGNFVSLYSPKRDESYVYMHMASPAEVKQGERIEAGTRVGRIGCTGSCWGDHLHFEIRDGRTTWQGTERDPLPELRRWKRK